MCIFLDEATGGLQGILYFMYVMSISYQKQSNQEIFQYVDRQGCKEYVVIYVRIRLGHQA